MNLLRRLFRNSGLAEPCTKQQRKTAVVMLVLTSIYLIVELAFNARLLDVVGALEGGEAVENIEKYGRLISGMAVALIVLGKILDTAARAELDEITYPQIIFPIIFFCGIAMIGVYVGQKKLVDTLVHLSTDEERRRAAVLVPMSKLIKTGRIGVPGFDLTTDDLNTPEGKTFLATFAFQTLSHPALFENLKDSVEPMFGEFAEQERKYNDGFWTTYNETVVKLRKEYDGAYTTANESYDKSVTNGLKQHKLDAWGQYETKLKAYRSTPEKVPPRHWKRVRHDVRSMGVPVPDNWRPSDQSGFEAALEKQYFEVARDEFRAESQNKLKLKLPLDPGLSFDQFMKHDSILDKWREILYLSPLIPLRVGLNAAQFNKEIYQPAIVDDVKKLMRENYAPAQEYGIRARHQKTGEDSYRALIVPPIALLFSLAGAMVHIFKVFAFMGKTRIDIRGRLYFGMFAVYLIVVALVPMMWTNKITSQEKYKTFEAYTKDARGSLMANGIRWTIQFQTYFNPVNEFVQTKILLNPQFDGKIQFLENPSKEN